MTTTGRRPLSKTSINALTAIDRFRRQRRAGRVWLIGDKRISAATVTSLERQAYLKEIAPMGSPVLVLTDQGKQIVGMR